MSMRTALLLCLLVFVTLSALVYILLWPEPARDASVYDVQPVMLHAQPQPVPVALPPVPPPLPEPVVEAPPEPKLRAGQSVYMGFVGRWRKVTATAYSPHDPIDHDHWSSKDNITATGVDWREEPYGIAVPYRSGRPLFVPYGTRIIVPAETGYVSKTRSVDRIFVADDTGGGITRKTRRSGTVFIDLRFKTTAGAVKWVGPAGSRKIEVFIIEE